MLTQIAAGTGAMILAAGGYAYASSWPTSQIFGRTLVCGADPAQIALTFDDGPNEIWTPKLLDLLSEYGVKATFFVIGSYAAKQPSLMQRLAREGHLVGNHTWSHPVLLWQSPRRVREELTRCNQAIEDVLGQPVHYFRPPHGARRPDVLRCARELGLKPVMWNVMGHDWDAPDAATIVARVTAEVSDNRKNRNGSNVLLHDGSQAAMNTDRRHTLDAVAALLEAGRMQGVAPLRNFVRVDAWG